MLVLTRKSNESIKIGTEIEIKVIEIRGNAVRLGISAPLEISVHRKEIYEAIQKTNVLSAKSEKQPMSNLIKLLNKDKKT
jgi:carbon storage regulator